jgi:hypothetical protein
MNLSLSLCAITWLFIILVAINDFNQHRYGFAFIESLIGLYGLVILIRNSWFNTKEGNE